MTEHGITPSKIISCFVLHAQNNYFAVAEITGNSNESVIVYTSIANVEVDVRIVYTS